MIDITANISVPHGAHFTLRACHDTGADIMGVPRHYIDMIQQAGVSLTTQGYCVVQIAGDIVCHKVYEFDVSLAGVGPAATSGLGPWMRVQVMELPDVPGPDFGRILSGPFLRFMCYTATCPDGQGNLYVTYNKTHLGYLPDLPPGFVPFGLPHLPTAPAPPGGGPPGSLTTSGAVASQTPAAPPQKRGKTPTRQAPRKKQRKAGI